MTPDAELDHLVVAAAALEQGCDWLESGLGVRPQPGGKHVAMGTHNALLRLSPTTFIEVIAIDPAAPPPSRPRWFDLDDVRMRATLAEGPRLVHFVARTRTIDALRRVARIDPGPVHPMARGDLHWRITIPDDGHLPGAGLVPTLIEWPDAACMSPPSVAARRSPHGGASALGRPGGTHPAARMPDARLSLAALAGEHPDPAPVRAALAALGLGDTLKVTYGRHPRLAAMIRTPRGVVTL